MIWAFFKRILLASSLSTSKGNEKKLSTNFSSSKLKLSSASDFVRLNVLPLFLAVCREKLKGFSEESILVELN